MGRGTTTVLCKRIGRSRNYDAEAPYLVHQIASLEELLLSKAELRYCHYIGHALPFTSFEEVYVENEVAMERWEKAKVVRNAEEALSSEETDEIKLRLTDLRTRLKDVRSKINKDNIRIPDVPKYNAVEYPDPQDYIDMVTAYLTGKGVDRKHFHRGLLVGANPAVAAWYRNLPKSERSKWKKTSARFVEHFSDSYVSQKRQNELEFFRPSMGSKFSANLMRLSHMAERADIPDTKQSLDMISTRVNSMLDHVERLTLRSATAGCASYKKYLKLAGLHLEDRLISADRIECSMCSQVGHAAYWCPMLSSEGVIAAVTYGTGFHVSSNNRKRTVSDANSNVQLPKNQENFKARLRVCYTCGSSDHLARDCNQMSEKVKLRLAQVGLQCLDSEGEIDLAEF
jgi:hypothetical protein